MVRLDEIGVVGERFECHGLVLIHTGNQFVLQRVHMRKPLPGKRRTHILPDPLGRVELGTARRLKEQRDVGGQLQTLGRMGAGVVQQQNVEALGVGLGELVEEDLHVGRVELRQNQPEGIAGIRVNTAIQPTAAVLILGFTDWLDPTGGDAPAADGTQVPAALVLGKDPNWQSVARWNTRPQGVRDSLSKGADGVGSVFLGLGRSTLGLPPKRARTRLPKAPVVITVPWRSYSHSRIAS
jgi:hypothetical protein